MSERFVGRRKEMSRLAELLDAGRKGHGRIVTVAGDAGIGKTRLMAEAALLANRGGSRVLWSQIIEDPVAPPYAAWLFALRSYIHQIDIESLRADLGTGASHIAHILPDLRELLGLDEARPSAGGDSAARFQLYDSVTRFLLAAARREPLVLLFDNMHLADHSSLLLMDYYARQLKGSPSLVIAAHRNEHNTRDSQYQAVLSKLERNAGLTSIELTGLERDEVGQLLGSIIGTLPSPAFVNAVHARGDGNPLFTHQVATNLVSNSLELDGFSLDGPFDIPSSLGEVIESRLESLDQQTLDVLRNAAILGRDFETSLLAKLCGEEEDCVSMLVERAVDAGIVMYRKPGCFRFEHALFRESIYTQHTSQSRQQLHLDAARSLTEQYEGSADPPVAQLAYHWFEASRGHSYAEAVVWCRHAANDASAKRAYGEAVVQIEHTLALLSSADNDDAKLRFEILSELAEAQYLSGQHGLSSETWLKVALLAKDNGWPSRLANAVMKWQYVRAATGLTHVSNVSLHEAALECLPKGSEELHIRLLASLSVAYVYQGEPVRARESLSKSVEQARQYGDTNVLFDCLIKAFYILHLAHESPQRLAMLTEALALAPQTGIAENTLLASMAQLFPLADLGRFNQIRKMLDGLSEKVTSVGHVFWRQVISGFRVKLALMDGRWNDVMQYAQDSLQQGSFEGATGVEGRFGFQMCEVHRALGTLEGIAPLLQKIAASENDARTWLPGQLLLHCELKQEAEARDVLEQLGDIEALEKDSIYETSLVYLTEVCVWLSDHARCRQLYDALKPYRGYNLALIGVVVHGAASGFLARLASVLGRETEARRLFDEAVAFNESMNAPTLLARIRTDYAELLLRSEIPVDQARALRLLVEARATAELLTMRSLLSRVETLESATSVRATLTSRECEVLRCIAAGASNKRIAETLHVSISTVATHVRNILRKTAAGNRTEAVAYARRCGLIPPS